MQTFYYLYCFIIDASKQFIKRVARGNSNCPSGTSPDCCAEGDDCRCGFDCGEDCCWVGEDCHEGHCYTDNNDLLEATLKIFESHLDIPN